MMLLPLIRNRNGGDGSNQKNKGGFTLIELLVVIAVIAVLVSMLLPALQGARAQAKKVVCGTQLKQVGTIWLMYADENNDVLPIGYPGGSFNYIYWFLRDELIRLDVSDGKIFYCPDYILSDSDGDGVLEDWYNPRMDQPRPLYPTGYSLFTNVIDTTGAPGDPLASGNLPWRSADGTGGNSLSWLYAVQWADLELKHLIPPVKTTERRHLVSGNSISIVPSEAPILFDRVLEYSGVFYKRHCHHIDGGKGVPLGRNAVYLDGHVEWRRFDDMGILRDYGGGTKRWF